MSLRTLSIIAATLAAGIGAGRALVRTKVETTKNASIQRALEQARIQVKSTAEDYIRASLTAFSRRLLIKAGLLSLVAAAVFIVSPGALATRWVILAAIGLILVWDIIVAFPTVRLIAAQVKQNGPRPKRALGSAVAAHVFAAVLEEAEQHQPTKAETLVLLAAGTREGRFKTEIAKAVSTLAAETSWRDVRPYLMLAIGKIAVLFALYSGYVWAIFFTVATS
ncbi:MAG: hypothetical protein AAFQ85_06000 [Pseudomonadota bacterium]